MVQLLSLYMTTGKIIGLTIWTFVGKGMSLLLNTVYIVIAFFSQGTSVFYFHDCKSLSAMILEPKNIKFVPVSIVSPSICHEVMGPDNMILVF